MAGNREREQLHQKLQDIDAQIAELRASTDDLRAHLGSDGAQDSEDTAAALTSVEENEGVLNALEQRRATVLRQLGTDG
jgi:prefoldin subunit 5